MPYIKTRDYSQKCSACSPWPETEVTGLQFWTMSFFYSISYTDKGWTSSGIAKEGSNPHSYHSLFPLALTCSRIHPQASSDEQKTGSVWNQCDSSPKPPPHCIHHCSWQPVLSRLDNIHVRIGFFSHFSAFQGPWWQRRQKTSSWNVQHYYAWSGSAVPLLKPCKAEKMPADTDHAGFQPDTQGLPSCDLHIPPRPCRAPLKGTGRIWWSQIATQPRNIKCKLFWGTEWLSDHTKANFLGKKEIVILALLMENGEFRNSGTGHPLMAQMTGARLLAKFTGGTSLHGYKHIGGRTYASKLSLGSGRFNEEKYKT